jgi:two-component system chemotaxis sensor kinase CheA
MIPDDELRTLFKAESEEHLQQLEQGLLHLEKQPDDKATLELVFREAHSLKGAARMLGLSNIEMLAHGLEDVLRAASRGELPLVPAHIDRLCAGVDTLTKMVNEALTGEPAEINLTNVLHSLDGREPAKERRGREEEAPAPPQPEAAILVPPQAEKSAAPVTPAPPAAPAEEPGAVAETPAIPSQTAAPHGGEYHIDTVRVPTRNLDSLMTHAGELMVTRTHVARRLHDADTLLDFWEDWNHEAKLAATVERHRARLDDLGKHLARVRNACYEDNARLDAVCDKIDRGVRAMRMLPVSTVFNLFPRMARDIAREEGKEVELALEGGEIEADKHILEKIKDPVMHMLRNAIDHGIETPEERERAGKPRAGNVRLSCRQVPAGIVVEVVDDGRGLDLDAIRQVAAKRKLSSAQELAAMPPQQLRSLIFVSGFSTRKFVTDISGRGIGLDVVRASVEELKGTVEMDSTAGRGSAFRMRLPITLATTRVLLAALGSRAYGLPVDCVETSLRVRRPQVFTIEGRSTVALQGEAVSVANLSELLELRAASPRNETDTLVCIIVRSGEDRLGLLVDDVVGEQEVVVKPAGALLKRVRNVSGAAILGSGDVCMILAPQDLVKSVRKRLGTLPPKEAPSMEERRKPVILLVEDSITTRTQEKRILESSGYEIVTAVDGLEAWEKLGSRPFDAVVSDIQMPNMDGFTLTERIRRDKRYADLPVILVTTLTEAEDKRRGLESGANAYITKSAFDQSVLVGTLQRLV